MCPIEAFCFAYIDLSAPLSCNRPAGRIASMLMHCGSNPDANQHRHRNAWYTTPIKINTFIFLDSKHKRVHKKSEHVYFFCVPQMKTSHPPLHTKGGVDATCNFLLRSPSPGHFSPVASLLHPCCRCNFWHNFPYPASHHSSLDRSQQAVPKVKLLPVPRYNGILDHMLATRFQHLLMSMRIVLPMFMQMLMPLIQYCHVMHIALPMLHFLDNLLKQWPAVS